MWLTGSSTECAGLDRTQVTCCLRDNFVDDYLLKHLEYFYLGQCSALQSNLLFEQRNDRWWATFVAIAECNIDILSVVYTFTRLQKYKLSSCLSPRVMQSTFLFAIKMLWRLIPISEKLVKYGLLCFSMMRQVLMYFSACLCISICLSMYFLHIVYKLKGNIWSWSSA